MTDERDELNKMLHDLNQRFGTNFKLLGNVAMDVMKPTRRVEQKGDGYIVYVKPPAFFTQEEVAVPLTADQFKRYQYWREGMGTIQELLGYLSAKGS